MEGTLSERIAKLFRLVGKIELRLDALEGDKVCHEPKPAGSNPELDEVKAFVADEMVECSRHCWRLRPDKRTAYEQLHDIQDFINIIEARRERHD